MASHYTCLLTWHHIIPACWHGITLYLPVCFVWWRDDGLIANCNLQPKPTKGNVSYVLTDNLSFPFNLEFVQDRTSFSELDRQCLLSVSTVSVYRQCVPSVCTVSVYRQCVPSVCTVSVYRQCVPSVSTVSVYRQCVPSVSTVSVYRQCVPSVCTVSLVLYSLFV